MHENALLEYLKADFAGRLLLAARPDMEPILRGYLGQAGYDEIRRRAQNHRKRTAASHLGSGAPKNLIFIPGVMGSLLMPRNAGGVWWLDVRSARQLDRLRLAPDGTDRDERFEVEAFQIDQMYNGFLDAVFDSREFGCVTHPYDWRKSLWATQEGSSKESNSSPRRTAGTRSISSRTAWAACSSARCSPATPTTTSGRKSARSSSWAPRITGRPRSSTISRTTSTG